MRVLALEPYYGGSHRAFLDGWAAHSRHEFTIVPLPAHKWKWRMRHASWTLASHVEAMTDDGLRWDCIFCSDMLNLPEFLGLAPPAIRNLPAAAYFHENQLTYPDARKDPRDVHFGLSNMVTALAAEPWFNSAFGRDSFLEGLAALLEQMPDYPSPELVERIRSRSRVMAPGIDPAPLRPLRRPGPLRIAWAARWEHDKGPEAFFAAIEDLSRRGVDFRLSVLGERFRRSPDVFDAAAKRFADRIDHWGFEPRNEYCAALADADVFVSTAVHEFFGLSVAEAAAAGAMPVLPRRLAYPEVFGLGSGAAAEAFFYDGDDDATAVANRLALLAQRLADTQSVWPADPSLGRRIVEPLFWPRRAEALDEALEAVMG